MSHEQTIVLCVCESETVSFLFLLASACCGLGSGLELSDIDVFDLVIKARLLYALRRLFLLF